MEHGPVPELLDRETRCPICWDDWDVNYSPCVLPCCCQSICVPCVLRLGGVRAAELAPPRRRRSSLWFLTCFAARPASPTLRRGPPCPLCRTPCPATSEEYVKLVARNADAGNAAALGHLGRCFRRGMAGFARDDVEAAAFYARAAALGDVDAMLGLGFLYFSGAGVPEDARIAARYFALAAARGDATAEFNLAWCYYSGAGVPEDRAAAARLYERAAARGYTHAEFNCGVLFALGDGVPRDLARARSWLARAAGKGNAAAERALAGLGDV